MREPEADTALLEDAVREGGAIARTFLTGAVLNTRAPRVVSDKDAAWRGIQHRDGSAVTEREREQRRRENVFTHYQPPGRVVQRPTGRTVAIIGGIPVQRAGSEVVHVGPAHGRVDGEHDRRVEPARRMPRHLHPPAHRKDRSTEAPVVIDAKDHVLAIGDFGPGIDAGLRLLDRLVSGRKLAKIIFRARDLQPGGLWLKDSRRRSPRDFDTPLACACA